MKDDNDEIESANSLKSNVFSEDNVLFLFYLGLSSKEKYSTA